MNAPRIAQRKVLANILIVDDDIAVQAVMRLLLDAGGLTMVSMSFSVAEKSERATVALRNLTAIES